ncbi:MAG: hypothetical protein K2W96_25115, partial [Gemmataceae bacterium]|nr:hypothetical protein [Gemmataceae bacterium]
RSPQAKGRVGRSFGTAQDRWVKALRLAGAKTAEEANEALARLVPGHNRKFAKEARDATDAHRDLGPGHDLASILSLRTERTVGNDYVVRSRNRFWQLAKPALPGLRGQGAGGGEAGRDDGDPVQGEGAQARGGQRSSRAWGLRPQTAGVWRFGGRCQRGGGRPGLPPGRGRDRWHAAVRQALGPHSCGALSSCRRGRR